MRLPTKMLIVALLWWVGVEGEVADVFLEVVRCSSHEVTTQGSPWAEINMRGVTPELGRKARERQCFGFGGTTRAAVVNMVHLEHVCDFCD